MLEVQVIDAEGVDYNGSSQCKFCGKTIYWNNACRNRQTKKKAPLDEPYLPAVGSLPKGHVCDRTIEQPERKPILNDMTRKLLYKPLDPWEIRQVEEGRINHEKLRRPQHGY